MNGLSSDKIAWCVYSNAVNMEQSRGACFAQINVIRTQLNSGEKKSARSSVNSTQYCQKFLYRKTKTKNEIKILSTYLCFGLTNLFGKSDGHGSFIHPFNTYLNVFMLLLPLSLAIRSKMMCLSKMRTVSNSTTFFLSFSLSLSLLDGFIHFYLKRRRCERLQQIRNT